MSQRWDRVQELFLAALERDAKSREGFLEEACAGDADLLDQVRQLLTAHDGDGRFDRLVGDLAPPLTASPAERALPEQIGAYRILRELGQGGMGAVFLAERADGQFEHQVALKLLRQDLLDKDLHRRFLAERQILARLKHPHIARLFDGGLTEYGRPYFVMEHVEGVPIDAYCDDHRLSLAERLELFRTVCAAVHYAHRHLVVHRDLKPANILVTEEGTVKLLDFGIAKLLDSEAFPQTVAVTEPGMWLMTPDYASPEQVRGEAITTASDVYQLGVLLYGLLTGHRPYNLPSRSLHDVTRVVCETPPGKPSTAVHRIESIARLDGTTLEITPETVSQARRTSTEGLRRRLKGDLDNIVLLALRKEPERRYGSVEQFSEDVRRYLEKLPVTARQDTIWYRASTFLRRNRLAAATALAILALVVGSAVAMALQARRTAQERDKAEHVASFLVELFEVSNPGEARGNTVTAREILDRGSERVKTELQAEPEVQAAMMDVIGRVYVNLGLYQDAEPLLEEALALRRDTLGPSDVDVAASLHNLGGLYEVKGDDEDAESAYRQALTMRQELFGESHPDVADSLAALAVFYQHKNDLDRAEPLTRQALAMRRELLGDVHPDVAKSLHNLAYFLHEKGDYDEAERRYREVIATKRALYGDTHPDLVTSITNLGWLLKARDDLDAAESLFREALAIRRTLYGEQHPFVARSLSALADLLLGRGRHEEAEPLVLEALAMRRALLGDEHPELADDLHVLATIELSKGDVEAAERLYRESIAVNRPDDAARTLNSLASLLEGRGDLAGAESLYRESWTLYRQKLGDAHPFVAIVQSNIAGLVYRRSAYDEAEPLYREALQNLQAAWGEEHPRAIGMMVRLGRLLVDRQEAPAAEPLLRQAVALLKRTRPDATAELAGAHWVLGRCLTALARYEEAEELLLEVAMALSGMEQASDEDSRMIRQQLIVLYEAWDKPAEADRQRSLLSAL